MQKICCFVLLFLPLNVLSQQAIDFYSSAPLQKEKLIAASLIEKGEVPGGNSAGHCFEITFNVLPGQQQVYDQIKGILVTQKGQLHFMLGNPVLLQKNTLSFTGAGNSVYVSLNGTAPIAVEDEQRAFTITYPGFHCSLYDGDGKLLSLQPVTVTRKYVPVPAVTVKKDAGQAEVVQHPTVAVYPNPARSVITVTHDLKNLVSAKLLDMQGRVLAARMVSRSSTWQVNQLPAGMYLIVIGNGGQQIKLSFIKL